MSQLFLFSSSVTRDPAIEVWLQARPAAGKLMRHVKVCADAVLDDAALQKLIQTAYADMRRRVRTQAMAQAVGWCCP